VKVMDNRILCNHPHPLCYTLSTFSHVSPSSLHPLRIGKKFDYLHEISCIKHQTL